MWPFPHGCRHTTHSFRVGTFIRVEYPELVGYRPMARSRTSLVGSISREGRLTRWQRHCQSRYRRRGAKRRVIHLDDRPAVEESIAIRTLTTDCAVTSTLRRVGSTETVHTTPSSSVTTGATTDLLGRVLTATDYWQTETTTTYAAQTGRVLTVTTQIL